MTEPQGSPPPGEATPPKTNGALVPISAAPPREIRVVTSSVGLFDTGKFEHLQRIATVMAVSETVPVSLCYGQRPVAWNEKDGKITKWEEMALPREAVQARCLMICDQAERWRMNPFELLHCASYIRNRLSYEGKVVHAAIESMLGIKLRYTYTGEAANREVTVLGQFRDEATPRDIKGTVAQWRTSGDNSPWANPLNFDRQLAYRGAREWARRHAPGVILGVITDDETLDHDEPIVKKQIVAPDISDEEEDDRTDVDVLSEELTKQIIEEFTPAAQATAGIDVSKTKRVYIDPDAFLASLENQIAGCDDQSDLAHVAESNETTIANLPEPHRSTAMTLLKEAEG